MYTAVAGFFGKLVSEPSFKRGVNKSLEAVVTRRAHHSAAIVFRLDVGSVNVLHNPLLIRLNADLERILTFSSVKCKKSVRRYLTRKLAVIIIILINGFSFFICGF